MNAMLALGIVTLIAVIAVASALTLLDCWIRGRYVFESLKAERALLDAGFVPVVPPAQMRLRKPVAFETLAMPQRPVPRVADQRRAPARLRSRQAARGVA